MAGYPPKKNTAFTFGLGVISQADNTIFQANPTIAVGDFKVSTDGGAFSNLGNLPAVTPAGSKRIEITLSAAEMNGDYITVVGSDQAGGEWNDVIIEIQTSAAQIDDIETDTQDIQSRIPAALSSGNIKADVLAISTSSPAADNLEASALSIVAGQAQTGTLSTTEMTTNLTEVTDDHYIGRIVIWTSGALAGQASDITDYTGSTKKLTYTAVTEAPSNGDTFVIV